MKLNEIYGSNMVFPANKPIRICGTGKGKVSISFGENTTCVVSQEENWCIEFPPMSYGGPYKMVVTSDSDETVFDNIYIGEVYLFAGQSNIEMMLKDTSTPEEMYETNEALRMFCVGEIGKPCKFSEKNGWMTCDKEEVGDWSALAYLSGQIVQKQKGIAVGVIVCCQGASVIESWLPCGTLEELGINIAEEDKFMDHTYPDFAEWNKDGALYEKSLCKVSPYPVSAVVWYQGESDASVEEGKVYAKELCAFIDRVRMDFCDESLSFAVVQIADYTPRDGEGWRLIQKAQMDVSEMRANVRTVISSDVCEKDDIHPPTKDKLAKRISDLLLYS